MHSCSVSYFLFLLYETLSRPHLNDFPHEVNSLQSITLFPSQIFFSKVNSSAHQISTMCMSILRICPWQLVSGLQTFLLLQPPPHQNCNGDIIAYRVEHRVVGGNEDWQPYDAPTPPNASKLHTIEHLHPATSYSIRVAAVNSSGCGRFSLENECTTHQGKTSMYNYSQKLSHLVHSYLDICWFHHLAWV